MSVLVCVSVAVITVLMQSSLGKEKVCVASTPSHSLLLREVRVGGQAGTWRQGPKQRPQEVVLPTALLHGSLGFLSRVAQGHNDGIIHSILSPPTSITILENISQTCPQGNLMEAVPRSRVPFPRYI